MSSPRITAYNVAKKEKSVVLSPRVVRMKDSKGTIRHRVVGHDSEGHKLSVFISAEKAAELKGRGLSMSSPVAQRSPKARKYAKKSGSRACGAGRKVNPETGRCKKVECAKTEKVSEKSGRCVAKKCPAGSKLNEKSGRCKKVEEKKAAKKGRKPMTLAEKAKKCRDAGKVLDKDSKKCRARKSAGKAKKVAAGRPRRLYGAAERMAAFRLLPKLVISPSPKRANVL